MTDPATDAVSPFNLANLFTAVRIILSPVVAWLFVTEQWVWGLIVGWAVGMTDFFDGLVARRLGLTSKLGALLDPVADKILIGTVGVCLLITGVLPVWFVAVVLGRDLLILAGSAPLLRKKVHPHGATYLSKVNTCLVGLAATVAILGRAVPGSFWDAATPYFLIASAALTVISGVHYVWIGVRLYRDRDDG
jgi:CDP-diacylglycerol--glycerol-3-phosphate 3-phosphatidyltransferase